jgi:hypothetical protein
MHSKDKQILAVGPSNPTGKPGMMVPICIPSIWEAEARGWWIQGQPGVCSETLSQKTKTITTTTKIEPTCFYKG